MVKKIIQKPNEVKVPPVVDLYTDHDPLPVPEVLESDSDSVWALWEETVSGRDSDHAADFQKTERADLMDLPEFTPVKSHKRHG
jgi:hypothetical protein